MPANCSPLYSSVGGALKEGAAVFHSIDQLIKNETPTILAFDNVRWDTDKIYNPENNTRLTCKTAGVYLICAHIIWDRLPCEGFRQLAIKLNGVNNITTDRGIDYDKWAAFNSCTTIWQMEVGDWVEAVAFHSSVDNEDLLPTIKALAVKRAMHRDSPEFRIHRIG